MELVPDLGWTVYLKFYFLAARNHEVSGQEFVPGRRCVLPDGAEKRLWPPLPRQPRRGGGGGGRGGGHGRGGGPVRKRSPADAPPPGDDAVVCRAPVRRRLHRNTPPADAGHAPPAQEEHAVIEAHASPVELPPPPPLSEEALDAVVAEEPNFDEPDEPDLVPGNLQDCRQNRYRNHRSIQL